MKFMKYLLPVVLATCGFTATAQADAYSTERQERRERDMQAVSDFIRTKRSTSLQGKSTGLMISGDIEGSWYHLKAHSDGHTLRGRQSKKYNKGDNAPFGKNEAEIKLNLALDYKTDKTWASTQLQFDNAGGIRKYHYYPSDDAASQEYFEKRGLFGSGELNSLALRKAYWGMNLIDQGASRLDVEIGRRRLYDAFDSEIQFDSYFDGILVKYANTYEGAMDFTAKAAAFVIDSSVRHIGYIAELGFLNIVDQGLDLKYSLVHWNKNSDNRYGHHHPSGARFLNSQVALAYNISPDMLKHKAQVYAAYIHNHRAKHKSWWKRKKPGNAWYLGFTMGEVKAANDWAFDVRYEWVGRDAIPERDISGITRDNPAKISQYQKPWGGWGNYKGFVVEGFYAITDNLTFNPGFERVTAARKSTGGSHKSSQLKGSFIYAF